MLYYNFIINGGENMIIRKAKGSDAKAILEYCKIIGGETDNLTFGNQGVGLTLEQEKDYLDKMNSSNNSIYLVADDEGEIVGCLNLNSFSKERLKHNAELGISIKKDYWHKGIGSMLIKEAIEFAKKINIDSIHLTVRSDNERAKSLYTKFGFKKTGTFYRYIKIGKTFYDCDLMHLFLNESPV